MCPRRRFYKGPVTSVAAGKKERVLFHKGKICVKQLNLYYNANNTTGTYNNKWSIKVDSVEIINMSALDIFRNMCGYITTQAANRPIICGGFDTSEHAYSFIIHDLGVVNEGIEVWLENKDTTNSCDVFIGMVYDVLE